MGLLEEEILNKNALIFKKHDNLKYRYKVIFSKNNFYLIHFNYHVFLSIFLTTIL